MRLALAVIAKDETEKIKNLIKKYEQYFDELAFAIDDEDTLKDIEQEFGNLAKLRLHKYEWQNNFAHKRNFLAERIKSEYYFRLDTDDGIDKPHLIRRAFDEYVRQGFNLIMFSYLYGFDASGNCNAKHWRETIIKNDGNLYWNKAIHENILPRRERKLMPGKEKYISVIHKATPEERKNSTERNLRYLLEEYKSKKEKNEKQDPRTMGYIARMYLALQRFEEAIPFFENFLKTSGWDGDKYQAWNQLADCYAGVGRLDWALNCCIEALVLNPKYPDAYFKIMGVYYDMKDYKKAVEWGRIGFEKPTPDNMLIQDPSSYTWRPTAQLGMCYINIGRIGDGVKLLRKAQKLAPNEKELKEALNYFGELHLDNEAVKDYLRLMKYNENDLRKFRSLAESIPKKIAGDERIIAAKHRILPPKTWSKKSIAFFCGGAWEEWCDSSVIGGIGGSEEATIYLSRELTKMGYEVTIFNQCGELAGNYKGVEYKSFYEFNPRDEYNVLISWRHNIFTEKIKARRRLVWMHDIPLPNQFLPEDADELDKVIALSQYHRSFIKLPDEKTYVSQNGLNIPDHNAEEERDPDRMIYASSYDRGLEELLQNWHLVQKVNPNANLHIFYGWDTYLKMMKQGRRPKKFYYRMLELLKQDNVHEHGRVGHRKLVKEYAKSGIWAYPTTFTEISCIGAMRAQAMGAVPVTTDFSALKETVQYGEKVKGDVKNPKTFKKYAHRLGELSLDKKWQENVRKKMVPWAREKFDWRKVAEDWARNLF